MLLMFRLHGTVITKIWWQVLILVLFTAGLLGIHNFIEDIDIKFTPTLIPVLGTVLGLLLVFRTNTAYDRYYEGRKIWSTISLNIRNLTRCFWVMTRDNKENPSSREMIERISAINLLIAFPYAVKKYVRGKHDYTEEPLPDLIGHIPKLRMIISQNNGTKGGSSKRYKDYKAYDTVVPTNIPIEISHHVAGYIRSLQERDLVDGPSVSVMNTALGNLVGAVGDFERILRTPIPLAYSVHLSHALWIYLLALPFQLIGVMNWFAIPAVALASFTMLGMLSIGWEIENPFGYDLNDLPLDDFCNVIHTEALRITSRPRSTPDDWICPENHACHPVSHLGADELSKLEPDQVLTLLSGRMDKWVADKAAGEKNGHLTCVGEELRPMITPQSVVIASPPPVET